MKIATADRKRAGIWMSVAGVIAITVAYGIYRADSFLSNWDREEELHDVLVELRSAQYQVSSTEVDARIAPMGKSEPTSAQEIDFSLGDPSYGVSEGHGDDHH